MPSIVAVIVTHKRPAELQRLLDGLAASELPLAGCVISDHAPDGTAGDLARNTPWKTVVLEDSSNPGPGAGWANAAREALSQFPALDAIWYLDDDVVIAPSDLGTLWHDMRSSQADAIAPLLEDAKGQLWAFPEPESRKERKLIREAQTASEARQLLGSDPLPFCWCTGACFLVGRDALESTALHRGDFWMLGEDLEYSMRIATRKHAVFSTVVSIPHLPPTVAESETTQRASYIKFCSLLQNLSYLSFHASESAHMKSYLPGNFRRFFRTHKVGWQTCRDALNCFWNGAVIGEPAGKQSGLASRERILNHGN